jgi:hypothetical protein
MYRTDAEYAADQAAAEFVIQADYVTCASERLLDRNDEVNYSSVIDAAYANVKDDGSSTITLEQYLGNVVAVTLGDEPVHTVSVEGTFMQVVDYNLLYAMGDRAINVYLDKDNYQRIGSVRLQYLATGTPVAECVKCKGTLVYKGAAEGTSDRSAMEAFVLAIITHGHNHSAKWVTKTPIGEPVAQSIVGNDALVDKYNDVLFDQQVADAVQPAYAVARFMRVNGFA